MVFDKFPPNRLFIRGGSLVCALFKIFHQEDHKSRDIDLIALMSESEVQALYPACELKGPPGSKTLTLHFDNDLKIDISLFHMLPGEDYLTALTRYSKKLDFRVNAIFARLLPGDQAILDENVIDPLGGVEDIKNRLLEFVDPDQSANIFMSEPLRYSRAVRMVNHYNMHYSDSLRIQVANSKKLIAGYLLKQRDLGRITNNKLCDEFYAFAYYFRDITRLYKLLADYGLYYILTAARDNLLWARQVAAAPVEQCSQHGLFAGRVEAVGGGLLEKRLVSSLNR